MSKASNMNLAVEKALVPGTQQVDLKEALRFVLKALNKEPGKREGRLYHTLSGGLQDRLVTIGIPKGYLVDFALLMQELYLARWRGGARSTVWEIADPDFFDEFVTDEWIAIAIDALKKRHQEKSLLLRLKKKATQIPKNGHAPTEAPMEESPEVLEAMAEMVATVEELKELETKLLAENSELKKKLAEQPKLDANKAIDALVKRFKSVTKKKS